MKTAVSKTKPAELANNKSYASKADFEAMKKENNALKASVVALEVALGARIGAVEDNALKNSSRIDAVEEAKQAKRPAEGPLESNAKFPRFDVDGGPSYHYAEQCLPQGWQMLYDNESGRPFYYNQFTEVRQWARPSVAPPTRGGMMRPPPPPPPASINITNENNTNIAVSFSPQTAEIYAMFERGDITTAQLSTLKEARNMTKAFRK